MSCYVLDTSAVLTILNEERVATLMLDIPEAARSEKATVYLPFMALEHLGLRRHGREKTQQVLSLVEAWPVRIEHSTDGWRHEAAHVKATISLAVADAWICSLACLVGAELAHKDPEYDAVIGLQALRLPYKP